MLSTQLVIIASALATTVLGFPSTPSKAKLVSRDDVHQSYDYVIVGGGTSGLTVADRLTEDPRSAYEYPFAYGNNLTISVETVLVIERGLLDQHEEAFRIPRLLGTGPRKYYYNLTSTPQPGGDNRTFPLQAGCLVGGGSAINSMFFDRG